MRRATLPFLVVVGLALAAWASATPTAYAEDDDDDDDGGRGIFWMRGDVGLAYVDLRTFSYDNLFNDQSPMASDALVQTSGTGFQLGGSAGVRLLFLTIGGHVQLASYDPFSIGTLLLEVEAHLPVPIPVEPYVRVGFGYAWVGQDLVEGGDVSVNGYDIRAGAGIDIYLHEHFSIGAAGTIDVLNLSRQSFGDPLLMVEVADGNAVGLQLGFMAYAGLHL